MSIVNKQLWGDFTASNPNVHILQTPQWGDLKSEFGWMPRYLVSEDAGSQILFRKLPMGLTIAYIPKGPVGRNWEILLSEVEGLCRDLKTIVLYIEPDYWENEFNEELLLKVKFKRV
jgi:lipid II:glycine glycyltransferase (peptidoglycan interpeptide bridge formation enzyme)